MTFYLLSLFLISSGFFLFLLHRKFRRYIPILMYHRIADIPGDRNALPPAKFAEQMQYLQRNNFTTISLQELYDYYTCGKALPPNSVLLTFDDGYLDNLETGLPILLQYKQRAIVFPIAMWIGRQNEWECFSKAATRTMSLPELQQWQLAGMEIASHTMNHPFLTNCTPADLIYELAESKAFFESALQQPIDFLCYPYGRFNAEVSAAARQAGYKAAFAIFDGTPWKKIDLFSLPRIPIPARQSLWEFKLKLSSFHMLFIALRQGERRFKLWLRSINKKNTAH